MSTHLNTNANVSLDSNANVSLDSNANAIFQERIQIQMFGVALKYKYKCFGYAPGRPRSGSGIFPDVYTYTHTYIYTYISFLPPKKIPADAPGYTFANTLELISNVLALY